MTDNARIEALLRTSPELARLTSQNGWVDNDTLRFEVLSRDAQGVVLAVYFDELAMEGSGCVAGRIPCYGRLRVTGDTVEVL